ncbi:simple sugar transport system substrate-binding protein [Luteibacter rhizovicinus]|uniref:Simple sugar transport system substrate-binding protein n=1 Tax=Luteibacter rhizovicinus TaxID=242606 RepID=A0A4R3YWT8_9GAMM|nr:sugar ABC transporter substrate-binding protein [Luteibacter rhizovicinus]TCV95904.1 simple sugar transport system substrate-binding protein [Luteibacter rhizovicinus]
MRFNTFYALSAAALIFGVASSAVSAAPGDRYVLVTHAADSDSWWNTIKNSIRQASEDFGVEVDYRNPPNGDLSDMARLLEQAAARNYSGVAFDIADFNVLQKSAARVTAKGIPVVTINSGTAEESKKLGAIMHIGQPEYDAGKAAGERAKAAGITSFVCVNHYATNQASFQRCQGFADAIGADMRKSMIDSGMDPTVVASKVNAYLRNNPKTQAVLALGPNAAEPTIQVLEKMGLSGKTYFATFDLSPAIIQGIKHGTVTFAIDQQPYLQGYMGIAALVIAHDQKTNDPAKIIAALKANPKFQARLKEYDLKPVYSATGVSSGPAFVTKDNVATVEKYAGQYR